MIKQQTPKMTSKIYPYLLLVDRPNGWRVSNPEELMKSDYLQSQSPLPTEFVAKGTLVEFDPLCFPMSKFPILIPIYAPFVFVLIPNYGQFVFVLVPKLAPVS